MTAAPSVGLYGKLPSHGDFLRRRVSDSFVAAWDAWLQASIAASRAALADRWLDVYLTSPAWRFACASGGCGTTSIAGVVVPSVDRVGRHFPLTIVAELDLHESALLASVVTEIEPFFDKAEQLLVDTLGMQRVEFERFDEQVAALGQSLAPLQRPPRVLLDATAGEVLAAHTQMRWHIPCGSVSNLGAVFQQLLSRHLSDVYHPLVLLWTAGSSMVAPNCLVMSGLPPPEGFAALLDGSWAAGPWRSVSARVEDDRTQPPRTEDTGSLHFRSAAASDLGRVQRNTGDAFVERPDTGVWAVADGLGGPGHGEMAGRMTCDALVELVPESSFDDMVKGAGRRLRQIIEYLQRAAPSPLEGGSTVVAFLARETRCALLWVGGSNQVYRLRGNHLECLTRDHRRASLIPLGHTAGHFTSTGAQDPSRRTLAIRHEVVCGGDRFLLCSDGLTGAVPEAEILAQMADAHLRQAVDGLIGASKKHGARDNVTVLMIEACA